MQRGRKAWGGSEGLQQAGGGSSWEVLRRDGGCRGGGGQEPLAPGTCTVGLHPLHGLTSPFGSSVGEPHLDGGVWELRGCSQPSPCAAVRVLPPLELFFQGFALLLGQHRPAALSAAARGGPWGGPRGGPWGGPGFCSCDGGWDGGGGVKGSPVLPPWQRRGAQRPPQTPQHPIDGGDAGGSPFAAPPLHVELPSDLPREDGRPFPLQLRDALLHVGGNGATFPPPQPFGSHRPRPVITA